MNVAGDDECALRNFGMSRFSIISLSSRFPRFLCMSRLFVELDESPVPPELFGMFCFSKFSWIFNLPLKFRECFVFSDFLENHEFVFFLHALLLLLFFDILENPEVVAFSGCPVFAECPVFPRSIIWAQLWNHCRLIWGSSVAQFGRLGGSFSGHFISGHGTLFYWKLK